MAKINLEKIQSYISSIATLQTQDNLKQCSMAINDGIEFIDNLQHSLSSHYEKNSILQSSPTKNPAVPVTLNIINRLGLVKLDFSNSVNGITKEVASYDQKAPGYRI